MAAITVKEIIAAAGGRILHGDRDDTVFAGVSIDSRNIGEGELFVALRGQRFDGHAFLAEAMKRGRGAVVSNPVVAPVGGKVFIHVEDTLKALQAIARHIRMRRRLVVVGVTGTNGKTTTKELIASILGMKHRVLKNTGNLNNQIGLPLSLTRGEESDEFAVVEMGASMSGDIRELCDIALPDCGVITNIGPGHLEGFGSLDMVRKTKLELLNAVGTIALNADDSFLMEGVPGGPERNGLRVVTFGIDNSADVTARDIILEDRRSVFSLCLEGRCFEVELNVNGKINIYNALAAAALCDALGVEPEDIKAGIKSFKGVPMRLGLREVLGATVIDDVYNANPASMTEAVRELVRLRKDRAIAVLGDMLELGAFAEEAHRRLGSWMSELPVDVFIAVGEMMAKAAEEFSSGGRGHSPLSGEPSRVMVAADSSEARNILLGICREGDTILVKGSRGMLMEKVLEKNNGRTPGRSRDKNGPAVREAGNAL
jgi:UDP-N-acetylmuramoyl-tripeptide--D-alanyl-D-alanine ligase